MMLNIRPERAIDIDAIQAVHKCSFPTDAEARLVDQLRADGDLSISLVAERERQLVGHVAFSPVSVQVADAAPGAGLAPVAVLEPYRRHGIAHRLITTGLEACRLTGFNWVVVLGEPAYYQRFGFQPASLYGLRDEYGGGDAFMVKALVDEALPRDAGLVRYAAAFEMLG